MRAGALLEALTDALYPDLSVDVVAKPLVMAVTATDVGFDGL
jgi:hypothetical protein